MTGSHLPAYRPQKGDQLPSISPGSGNNAENGVVCSMQDKTDNEAAERKKAPEHSRNR